MLPDAAAFMSVVAHGHELSRKIRELAEAAGIMRMWLRGAAVIPRRGCYECCAAAHFFADQSVDAARVHRGFRFAHGNAPQLV